MFCHSTSFQHKSIQLILPTANLKKSTPLTFMRWQAGVVPVMFRASGISHFDQYARRL